MTRINRRALIAGGIALAWSATRFERLLAATPGPGPYGALGVPDANGLQLPAGFTSRVIARTGETVGPTTYPWHSAPDGGACFPVPGGGWVYVSNSEVNNGGGGASAVRFAADGSIVDAYRILANTTRNCSGGPTPWGTWLSCEENGGVGKVYECSPLTAGQGMQRPGLGSFNHEAVAVDASTGHLYLTEDDPVGRLYKFVPTTAGDVSSGTLYAAAVTGSSVSWIPTAANTPDRQASTTPFNGGEGIWAGHDEIYFTTKGDKRVWRFDPVAATIAIFHDCVAVPSALDAVDNITIHPSSGDIFVAEDGGNMELGILAEVDGTTQVTAFCRIAGHSGSEVAGPAFSPDGTRLYVSSQRGSDDSTGVTYEITGPFRTDTTPPPPPPPPPPPVLFVADTFERTVANGWGSADPGGPWTMAGGAASNFSVSGGAGRMSAAAGAGRTASLAASSSDAVVEAAVAVDRVQTGGGAYVSVLGRRVNASNDYRLKLRFQSNGVLAAYLVRRVNAAETTLLWANTIPFAANQLVRVKLRVAGTGPTSLGAKVWADGASEPTAWLFDTTDATAALQLPGGVGVEHYQSSTTTNGPIVSILDSITAGSTTAPPPPPNVAPVAAFTSTVDRLAVAFDARGSSDGDGTVAAWAWDFGDGTTGTGSTASHTYPAAGDYTVRLTVTDDDGASGTTTQSVTVTAPPPVTTFVTDTFARTLAAGWGSAETGGAWMLTGGATNFSVSGGAGRISVATGASRVASLAVSASDALVEAALAVDKVQTGGGAYVSLLGRRVNASNDYRLKLRFQSNGVISAYLVRRLNGAETTLAWANSVPFAPNQLVRVKLRVAGTGPTSVGAKVWADGASEPTAWLFDTTDATAALQLPGGVGVEHYQSSSSTNGPVVSIIDSITAKPSA